MTTPPDNLYLLVACLRIQSGGVQPILLIFCIALETSSDRITYTHRFALRYPEIYLEFLPVLSSSPLALRCAQGSPTRSARCPPAGVLLALRARRVPSTRPENENKENREW